MDNMEPIDKNPRILIEQDADPVLLNFNTQKLGLPIEEQILPANPSYIYFCRNKKRIIFKEAIL